MKQGLNNHSSQIERPGSTIRLYSYNLSYKEFNLIPDYFKSAARNLLRDKTNALISIIGLAMGMACCMLIGIHIHDELSYNRFNRGIKEIYRVNWITKDNSGINPGASTPVPFAQNLKAKIPEIDKLARLYQRNGEMESTGFSGTEKKRFQEQGIYFADKDVFSVFTIKFLEGDPNTALVYPNSVVITDEIARKYFGADNPVGRSLLYENKWPLKITGVVEKIPFQSDIRFDFLVSFETVFFVETPAFAEFVRNDWTFTPCETWIRIRSSGNMQKTELALNMHLQENGSVRNHEMNTVRLQPLNDIHLHAADVVGNESNSDISYLFIFAGIALLILLIANINFINLSIAQSIGKIKEVGIRKILGAEKKQIITGFLHDMLFTGLISFLIALVLTGSALPALNQLTGKQLGWNSLLNIQQLLLFTGIFFITCLLAGLYPAFFITRFNTVLALKGRSGDPKKKNKIQRILLTTQFVVSILLITATGIIYQQLQFLRNKPLGFQKQQMLVVPIFGTGAFSFGQKVDSSMRRRMNIFCNELGSYSRVNAVTASSEMPGQGFIRGLIVPEGRSDQDNLFAPWLSVDYNFIRTLKMEIVAGRDFSKTMGKDFLNAFIINESAVRAFGWQKAVNAIGKTFIRGKLSDGKKGQIIGVVKDFDFNSLNYPMEPLVIDVNPPRFTEFAISIHPDHIPETIEQVKKTWEKIFPERVFEYSFLENNINAQYKDKENFSRMIEWFAGIAILLSCSGLFSLALFMALKRTREIGIRKVLGAGVVRILRLLSADFIKIVLLASAIASPAAWWLMYKWLEQFAYHIQMTWIFFLSGPTIALLLAFITVGYQSLIAALVNPVKTLRSE
jgi:putative ABC transport system permease protein